MAAESYKSLYPEGYPSDSASSDGDQYSSHLGDPMPFHIDAPSDQIIQFSRQYLQRLNHEWISYLDVFDLTPDHAQKLILDIIKRPMDHGVDKIFAYNRNDKRIFKELSATLLEVAQDSHVNDELMEFLANVIGQPDLPSFEAAQVRLKVHYTLLWQHNLPHWDDRPIVLYERPMLLTSGAANGYRSWEAALHLCDHVTTRPGLHKFWKRRNVLELGTGTGIFALTCLRYLRPHHVYATDGDPKVIKRLGPAVKRNFRDYERTSITCKVYQWGESLDEAFNGEPPHIDTVVAADILYDPNMIPSIVATIEMFFEKNPNTVVIISSTVRNRTTYNCFTIEARQRAWGILQCFDDPKPVDALRGYYYDTTVPIEILFIASSEQLLPKLGGNT